MQKPCCKARMRKFGCLSTSTRSSVFLALWELKTLLLNPAISIATLAKGRVWSGAFDRLHPAAVTDALEKLGWHRQLCDLICQVHQHKRWISWDSHIDSCPLHVDGAIPQGCPLSPMLLAVVTSAGCHRTRGGTNISNIKQCVYMDDRTFWAATQ